MLLWSLVSLKVLVLQSPRLPIYQEVVEGLVSGLPREVSVEILPLPDDPSGLASKIASVDMVVPVGSPALRAVLKLNPEKPVIYTAVFNSAQFRINRVNFTGVSLEISPERQIRTLKAVFPNIRRVGVPYGEQSKAQAEKLFLMAGDLGVQIFIYAVTSRDEIPQMMKVMGSSGVDFVWLPVDTLFASPESYKILLDESRKHKLPLWGYAETHVEAGATFGMQPDFKEVGKATADILWLLSQNAEGTAEIKPGELVTMEAPSFHSFLNLKAVYHLQVAQDALAQIAVVFGK